MAAAGVNYRVLGQQIAKQEGIPWNVWDQLIQHESGWNPNAVSPVGAIGFGQLMPGTAQGLGVDPHDPVQNLRGSAKYFKSMLNTFGGNVKLALAAYNAGPAAVKKYGGVPPYAETQAYVNGIMQDAHYAGGQTVDPSMGGKAEPPPGPSLPGMPAGPDLAGILNFAKPSDASVAILDKLGGIAGRTAKAAQAPIPLPALAQPDAASALAAPPGSSAANPAVDMPPMIPVGGGLRGQVKMHTGGNIGQQYPNLRANANVDWVHINPALLKAVNAAAEKRGVVAVLNSGYRSSNYNRTIGGAQNSRHQSGLAVDAYINGHPIGEVIPPEEWARMGIRSGNVPGFFHGKPDPMHLDMAGIPVKTKGKK